MTDQLESRDWESAILQKLFSAYALLLDDVYSTNQ